jgi:ornithine cyclodeaminase
MGVKTGGAWLIYGESAGEVGAARALLWTRLKLLRKEGATHVAVAFDAAEAVFASLAADSASVYQSVRNPTGHRDALFGNKSGFDRRSMTLGLKAGGYWPENGCHDLPCHQSVTVLFDPETGCPLAGVSGNRLTAMRTAAAAAVSIDRLAREDVRTLGIIGAGVQAPFHIRAACAVRRFERILLWNRSGNRAQALAAEVAGAAADVRVVELDTAVADSDVLVTLLSSFESVVDLAALQAGAHVAAMGTDTRGKQELEVGFAERSTLFTDNRQQSVTIGECQHAVAAGLIGEDGIVPLEEVFAGRHPGRSSPEEITVYDGTGIGLQDLLAARAVLDRL